MEIVTSWMEEGLRKGLKRGRQEGQEGRQEKSREAITDVLEARFGELPYDLREQLARTSAPDRLKSLLGLAATAESLTKFQAAL